jgi:hypothetical protein
MRSMILILACATMFLPACGSKDKASDTQPQSKVEVASKVDAIHLKPGQWESSLTIDQFDMEGLPPGAGSAQMQDQMKASMNRAGIRHCVTPEQAAKPSGDMFSGEQAKGCTYQGFDMAGGTMKGTVICKREGSTITSTMAGHYASDSYDMVMDSQMADGPNGGMSMTMKMRTAGKWIGPDCAKGK